ncbi:hypothetical protein ACFY2K_04005 [Kitasatospora sp. NPDC001309]|uniref:hypothetical protein n=1 Tax=Kitasatospora sp. NPDC001309 TaxID=3364013 RepID=UPI0036BF7C23
MPQHSTPLNAARSRHAAAPHGRFDTLLTGLWAALHLPVIVLLAFAVDHQASTAAQPPTAAAEPAQLAP